MSFLVTGVAGVLIAFLAKTRFNNMANPVSFFSLGISVPLLIAYGVEVYIDDAIVLNMPVFAVKKTQMFNLSFAYLSAMLIFLIPWLFPTKRLPKNGFRSGDFESYRGSMFLVLILLVLSILIAILLLRTVPVISMISGGLDIRDYNEIIKGLPFGLVSIINTLSMLFIILSSSILLPVKKYMKKGRLFQLILFLFILFLCLWQGKRQLLMFFTFVMICRYYIHWGWAADFRLGRRSPISITTVMISLVALLFIIGDFVRYQEEGANVFSFVGYLVWPVHNMLYILDARESGFSIQNWAVLTELLPARYGGKSLLADFSFMQQIPSSPSGYLAYWWVDGGYLFSMVGVLLMSMLSLISYNYYVKYGSERSYGVYLMVLWVCITSGIYTHFISLNFFWLPVICIILLPKIRSFRLVVKAKE